MPDDAPWIDCRDGGRLGFYRDQTADVKIARPIWSIGNRHLALRCLLFGRYTTGKESAISWHRGDSAPYADIFV